MGLHAREAEVDDLLRGEVPPTSCSVRAVPSRGRPSYPLKEIEEPFFMRR